MICPNCKSRNVIDLPCDYTAHICCSCGFHWETSLIEELKRTKTEDLKNYDTTRQRNNIRFST